LHPAHKHLSENTTPFRGFEDWLVAAEELEDWLVAAELMQDA
jgi:hypothetical protein